MNPVCVRCHRELTCAKNGVLVVHPFEHAEPVPIKETEDGLTIVDMDALLDGSWKEGDIDFIAEGDKYRCPGCGHEIVMGFGERMDAFKYSQHQLWTIASKYDEVITIKRRPN